MMRMPFKNLIFVPLAVLLCACGEGQIVERGIATSKWKWEDAVKVAVKDILLHPEDAIFRLPKLAEYRFPDEQGKFAYCGLVNSKNLVGGFSEHTVFVAQLYQRSKVVDRNKAKVLALSNTPVPIAESFIPIESANEILSLCEDAGYSYEVLINAKKR